MIILTSNKLLPFHRKLSSNYLIRLWNGLLLVCAWFDIFCQVNFRYWLQISVLPLTFEVSFIFDGICHSFRFYAFLLRQYPYLVLVVFWPNSILFPPGNGAGMSPLEPLLLFKNNCDSKVLRYEVFSIARRNATKVEWNTFGYSECTKATHALNKPYFNREFSIIQNNLTSKHFLW